MSKHDHDNTKDLEKIIVISPKLLDLKMILSCIASVILFEDVCVYLHVHSKWINCQAYSL